MKLLLSLVVQGQKVALNSGDVSKIEEGRVQKNMDCQQKLIDFNARSRDAWAVNDKVPQWWGRVNIFQKKKRSPTVKML